MAITRSQQAKQMLQDGGRIGFKGGADMGTVSTPTRTATAKSVSVSPSGSVTTSRTKGPDPADDRSSALQTYNQKVVTGRLSDEDYETFDDVPLNKREQEFKNFLDRRKKVKGFGFSKFFEKPLQKFSDFNASINRPFFEKVIRAGKIPGLSFDATEEEFEKAYQDYMANRLAGKTDAYGNPMPGFSYDSKGNLVGSFRDDGPDPIPFIPLVEDDTEEDTVTPVRNLGGLTARIGGGLFNFDGPQFAADGGRIGLKGGADAATASFSKSAGSSRPGRTGSVSISPSGNVTFNPGGRDDPFVDKSTFEQTVNQRKIVNEARKQKPSNLENMFKTASELNYLRNLIRMNPQGLGISYFTNKIGNFLFPPAGAAEMTPEEKEQLLKDAGIESGTLDQKGYGDTIKKVIGDGTVTAGGEVTGTIPDLSNPDVLNKIAIDLGLPTQKEGFVIKEDVATPGTASAIKEIQNLKRNLDYKPGEIIDIKSDLEKLKDLSNPQIQSIYDMVSLPGQNRFTAAGGGIASLDREAFLLGGIAKGLKKAVRGVKKIAKSPIGKVALLAAGAGYGGFGPLKGLFSGVKGAGFLKSMAVNKSLLGTSDYFGGPTGILDLIKNNPMESIFAASALAGLMTPKEDEDEFDIAKYYAQNQLTPSQSVRGMGSEFDFYGNQFVADGGRIGYQKGSKEPVAKKTLPLIDMDGMEKDYRETGGFVEMGRMEKADDVPARLSKNEFVFTADAVRNAGDGDIDKGAEVMYNMMKNLEAGGEVSEESQGLEGARNMFQTSQRLGEVL